MRYLGFEIEGALLFPSMREPTSGGSGGLVVSLSPYPKNFFVLRKAICGGSYRSKSVPVNFISVPSTTISGKGS